MKNLDTARVSVVLLGTFSPSALDLPLLHDAKAIGNDDFAATKYVALAPDQVVQLSLPWGTFQVAKDRLIVEAAQAPYVRAADLILRCARELDPTCLVTMMGINVRVTLVYQTKAERDALGVRLVPPSAWGSWGKGVRPNIAEGNRDELYGGMTMAVMRATKDDEFGGWIDARVEPAYVDKRGFGVIISTNDHYPTPTLLEGRLQARAAAKVASETLLTVLEEKFDESVHRSMEIVESIASGD